MNKNLLLCSALAQKLYNEYAKDLPIIDYHNHLSMQDIIDDRTFQNITQLWITPDPYKHRAMRILGVSEELITGNADDYKKFEAWYKTIPLLVGNPLYHWSVMEIFAVFGINLEPFSTDAAVLWQKLNDKLKHLSAKTILGKFNIEYCAPCAAINDDLTVFAQLEKYAPSLRGDDIIAPNKEFITALEKSSGIKINNLEDFVSSIEKRIIDFKDVGCRYSDHALDNGFLFYPDDGKNSDRFQCVLKGKWLEKSDSKALESFILVTAASLYAKHGLVMQLHIGAQRQTSSRLREIAGPTGGYAAMGSCADINSIAGLLNNIEQREYGLPKTLLFTLNPSDNAAFATLCGSFSKDGVKAVISQGPAWWWCDHCLGINQMLDNFSSFSVLSTFTGMTTDSRSILSFVRHDYFRRVLCNWIALKVQENLLPKNIEILKDIIYKVCYENAKGEL